MREIQRLNRKFNSLEKGIMDLARFEKKFEISQRYRNTNSYSHSLEVTDEGSELNIIIYEE